MQQLLSYLLVIMLFLFSFEALPSKVIKQIKQQAQLSRVYAEDDEDEEDHDEDKEDKEDEHDEDDDDKKSQETETTYEWVEVPANVTTLAPQTPPEPVIRYITVIDPGFDKDTDGDGLVDAIDPNPQINEKELFTDDDNDGVPNASDKYKGENDFYYMEFEDQNQNGVIDSFEK